MCNSREDRVCLVPGTPVLIVGFTAKRPFDRHDFSTDVPEIVLAGHLLEPYVNGQAFLLAPGPMAGSVSPKGFSHQAFRTSDDKAFIVLRHRHHDARGAYLYFAFEDEFDTASLLRDARGLGALAWPDHLRFAGVIAARVALAYRSLDPYDRMTIRP
jgi:hypothetical protein